MNQEHQNPEYLALLAEEITQEELRALLRRLGEQEFGDPKPTIGAVVEATGADALTVSKMLRAIRSENLDQKIEKAFGPRDQKIEHLEARTERVERRVESISADSRGKNPLRLSASERRRRDYIDQQIEREERENTLGCIGAVIILPVAVIAIIVQSCSATQPNRSELPPELRSNSTTLPPGDFR